MATINKYFNTWNPIAQFILAMVLAVTGLFFSIGWGFDSHNDWNSVCFGLLGFIVVNPIMGIFQPKPLPYILLSLGMLLVFFAIFLACSFMGIIDKLSASKPDQNFIAALLVFYSGITLISQLIRAIFHMTKEL